MSPRFTTLLIPALAACVIGYGTTARAQVAEYTWTGATDDDYAVDGNWLNEAPDPDEMFVPLGQLNERGTIDNGDTVRLSGTTVLFGQIFIGRGTGTSGELIIEENGELEHYTGSLDPFTGDQVTRGIDVANSGSTGTLTVEPGGTLTSGYIINWGTGGKVFLDGSDVSKPVNVTLGNLPDLPSGFAFFGGSEVRVKGPNANITSNTFDMNGGTYVAEITGPTHSTFNALQPTTTNGTLVMDFTGYSPATTDTWTILNAPSIPNSFNDIQAVGANLLLGQRLVFNTQSDGGSNIDGIVSIEQQLALVVNRDTNEVYFGTGGTPVSIDGYSVTSAQGGLNPANWTSLQDGDGATPVEDRWRESPQGGTVNGLSELKPSGSTSITVGNNVEMGAVFSVPAATVWKQDVEDIQFEYFLPGGESVIAEVIYEGEKRYNDLVLVVDPVDGDVMIENQSNALSATIDGYTVMSEGGSLSTAGWMSLESDGQPNWFAKPTSNANEVTELQAEGFTNITSGYRYDLGDLFDTGVGEQDLVFSYLFEGDTEFTEGVVVYKEFTFVPNPDGLAGDYNGDDVVDAADYAFWRNTLNDSVTPGTGADGNNDGTINIADYNIWREHYGNSQSPVASSPVTAPEPGAVLMLAAAIGLASLRRKVA